MVKLLTSVIVAVWVVAIALIAAQNGARYSIQFLGFESIQIPFGLILAFSAAVGMVGAAVVLSWWQSSAPPLRDREDFER